MIFRCILPDWAREENPNLPKVVEGEFDDNKLLDLMEQFYNIYYLPNYPKLYDSSKTVEGYHIDTFEWVFVDMDLKSGTYKSKEEFIQHLLSVFGPHPTKVIDSGNGIHAYWKVSDLNGISFLRLQRRLCRLLNTDEAVCKIYQLMRYPTSLNTKDSSTFKECKILSENDSIYTSEQLDHALPTISIEDEEYCKRHYERTYRIEGTQSKVDEKIPLKFAQLIKDSPEVKEIWSGMSTDDRSKADYRLGHIMFASNFTKDEARSVLVNSAKALQRGPSHRISYADNIIDKIWTYEVAENKEELNLSYSVREILTKSGTTLKGTRFPCWSYLDATERGFRLGQVIGLVAGSGVGKTAVALNMFQGFVQNNPDYDHFFIPLEQPANEIADRWKTMCGDNTSLHDKVHVMSNYGDDGNFRNLSFDEIKDYLLKFQASTGRKIGCVVIDHIGALKKKARDGENQDIMDICHQMKAFAIQTNTLLVMQSQTSREKAGIGDLELNKDAAYGTVFFESYCDYLITIWQPLKRCYTEDGCPTITAFKFCKIRDKKRGLDKMQEDERYLLYFDPINEYLRPVTQEEETSFNFFLKKATNMRKLDRKTDLIPYKSTLTITEDTHQWKS